MSFVVSLVGYTNVGQVDIMNVLSKSMSWRRTSCLPRSMPPSARWLIGGHPLSAFRHGWLYPQAFRILIESFKSTLDEVREARHPGPCGRHGASLHDNHIDVVNKTLSEIGAGKIPTILGHE